ncbi:MAG: hypothetical protein ACR2GH_12685 [Pseudonocardia sp.]
MISATDYRDHVVTEAGFEAGLAAGFGQFPAVCGHTVIVCSLYETPGLVCPDCRKHLTETPEKPRHRLRRTWWRWGRA